MEEEGDGEQSENYMAWEHLLEPVVGEDWVKA
jgi:hypothetical protein